MTREGSQMGEGIDMVRGLTLLHLAQGGENALAVKTARGILDLARAAAYFQTSAPATADELIRQGERGVGELVDRAVADAPEQLFLDESGVDFGPCVCRPEKIICVGLNYRRHAEETRNAIPSVPILFSKFNNALGAHRGKVSISTLDADKFDYEAELVIVIGRRAARVSEAQALSCVFGYCTGNDFSARDLQSRTSQWLIGKTCDGFAPIGPYLVCADLVGDPDRLKIECRVNGELRQDSNTDDMIFNCAQIGSYASQLMTLEPGDIIFTGTPEGVILGYPKEQRVWLRPGDRISTRVEKLGTLEFSLV